MTTGLSHYQVENEDFYSSNLHNKGKQNSIGLPENHKLPAGGEMRRRDIPVALFSIAKSE